MSGSLTRCPIFANDPTGEAWEHDDCRQADHDEHDKQPAVVRKKPPKSEHRPQIGDEAGRQDELSDVVTIQSGFNHHRVDDGHRRGAKCDATDLRRVKPPIEPPATERERAEERQEERHEPNRHARPPVLAERHRVDLGSGEEGEDHRSETRQEGRVRGLGDMFFDARDVPCQRPEDDLDERDRYGDANADEGGK